VDIHIERSQRTFGDFNRDYDIYGRVVDDGDEEEDR
jgi:hypothetical protein